MPRGDGTGPTGQGPMTGRAAGYCAGYNVPGFANPVPGRRFWGRSWGRGRGYRWYQRTYPGYPAPVGYPEPVPYVEPRDEITYLENVAAQLKKELEAITKRIEELSKESTKTE